MKVLFVASEVDPLVKVGGLSDVVRSLPLALSAAGVDCRIVIPAYPSLDLHKYQFVLQNSFKLAIPAGKIEVYIHEGKLLGTGIPVYAIGLSQGLTDPSIYPTLDGPDALRFHLFCQAVLAWLNQFHWQPNILHCHDAMAALIPYLIKQRRLPYASILTIHNIVPQSPTPVSILEDAGINVPGTSPDTLVNLLELGVFSADKLTTVSPTYSHEVLVKPNGYGLETALVSRRADFSGILNGIDTLEYNPTRDPALVQTYTAYSASAGKSINKRALQSSLQLEARPDVPLFAFIGRISEQKGIELIEACMADSPLFEKAQLVLLGIGSKRYEPALRQHAHQARGQFSLQLRFDSNLAHQIYAAADFLLMPSKFEPCGLTQMIAMRYGTIPVVRKTGGLADTVIDISDQKQGTGIVFSDFTLQDFRHAIDRAIELYRHKPELNQLIARDMAQDFSWDKSAKDYLNLYQSLLP